MKHATLALALSGLAIAVPVAHAEPTASQFIGEYDSANAEQRQGLDAVARLSFNGVYWANYALTQRRPAQAELFCTLPEGLQPETADLIAMVRQVGAMWAGVREVPLGLAILQGLEKRYPCAR